MKQFCEAIFKGSNAGESWLLTTAASMSEVLPVLYQSQNRYDKKVASKSENVTIGGMMESCRLKNQSLQSSSRNLCLFSCFRRLREQSILAHQAETRAMRAQVCEVLTTSTRGHPSLHRPDLGYDAPRATKYMEETAIGDEFQIGINLESISACFDSIPIDASRAVKTNERSAACPGQ